MKHCAVFLSKGTRSKGNPGEGREGASLGKLTGFQKKGLSRSALQKRALMDIHELIACACIRKLGRFVLKEGEGKKLGTFARTFLPQRDRDGSLRAEKWKGFQGGRTRRPGEL